MFREQVTSDFVTGTVLEWMRPYLITIERKAHEDKQNSLIWVDWLGRSCVAKERQIWMDKAWCACGPRILYLERQSEFANSRHRQTPCHGVKTSNEANVEMQWEFALPKESFLSCRPDGKVWVSLKDLSGQAMLYRYRYLHTFNYTEYLCKILLVWQARQFSLSEEVNQHPIVNAKQTLYLHA